MSDPSVGTAVQAGSEGEVAPQSDSLTRGFLFADLRGYTKFVETHGAATAAELLVRYRALVREAIVRYRGTEIGTEGDSFFVVFPAVSAAVQCGLAITEGARRAAVDAPGAQGINVGVGIHAGETVDTPDGYVGSAVNIAARICAIAGPGQVFVSDTVRALTQSVVPVTFTPVGRRQLKGVKEPLMLYTASVADPAAMARAAARRRRFSVVRFTAVGAVVVVLAAGAVWWQARPAAALPPGPWKIGVLVPLQNRVSSLPSDFGPGQVNAVQMAVDETNAAGGIGGTRLELDVRDEGVEISDDTSVAAAVAYTINPRVLAIVGPSWSGHAAAEMRQTNEAGLLQCSPATNGSFLTEPGSRSGLPYPDRINYVRLATRDLIQGPAAASFAYDDLKARWVLLVDDTEGGRPTADSFESEWFRLRGAFGDANPVFRRALNPDATDFGSVLGPLAKPPLPIGSVYFGGFTNSGAVGLKQAMMAMGLLDVPFLSWDGLWDGSGSVEGSFLQRAGPAAANTYITRGSIPPVSADFIARYRAAFGGEPNEYSAAAYACTQVILEALRHATRSAVDLATLREALRAYAVDTAHSYQTVLGSVGFDSNGDSTQQFVTIYRADLGANGGKGDWVVVKQQDFGPVS